MDTEPTQPTEGNGEPVKWDSTRSDRRLMERAAKGRWNVPDEERAKGVAAAVQALELAVQSRKGRLIARAVATLAALTGQDQADEHLAARLAAEQDKRDGPAIQINVQVNV